MHSVLERSYPTTGPVNTWMGDRLRVSIPSWYVISQSANYSRSTQPCIPTGSLNRVPALL